MGFDQVFRFADPTASAQFQTRDPGEQMLAADEGLLKLLAEGLNKSCFIEEVCESGSDDSPSVEQCRHSLKNRITVVGTDLRQRQQALYTVTRCEPIGE